MIIIEGTRKAQDKFGHSYGSETFEITKKELEALFDGKQLATTINDEYSIFIKLEEGEQKI